MSIRKYQNSGVVQDATKVDKPQYQLKVKPKANYQQLVEANQPKETYNQFGLSPLQVKRQADETKSRLATGQIQLSDGRWITKEQSEQLKNKPKATGEINPDYSDPLTMGITMLSAPAKGLISTVGSGVKSKIGKAVVNGLDMIDPTAIGFHKSILSDLKFNNINKNIKNIKEANDNLVKQYNSPEFIQRAKNMGVDNETVQKMNYNANSLNNNSGYFDVESPVYKQHYSENAGGYVEKNMFDRIPLEAKQNPAYKTTIEDIRVNQGKTRVNPKLSDFNQKTIQTHEGTHKITDADNLIPENVRKELQSVFKKDDYFTTPTEIHARMNQMRHLVDSKNPYKKLEYSDLFEKDGNLKQQFEEITGSSKEKFASFIKDKQGFVNLMNKMYGTIPTAIGTGLGIKAITTDKKTMNNGGMFKEGGKLDCGCNKDQDGIDTDIFRLFPKDVMKVLNKSIGLDTSDYNDTVKDKMKEVAKNKGLNLRTMLEQNPLISKHIIMIEKHKQGGVFKFQQGGSPLSQYPNTAGIYTSPRPAVELQQGGQVNQMQQKFIQWLAGKLGAKSQQELQAKMQQLGQEGLKKAQEDFMQEQGQSQEMQQGGVQEQYRTMQQGGKTKGLFKTDRVDKKLMEESDALDKSKTAYQMIRNYSLKDSYGNKDKNYPKTQEEVDRIKLLKSKVKSTFQTGGITKFQTGDTIPNPLSQFERKKQLLNSNPQMTNKMKALANLEYTNKLKSHTGQRSSGTANQHLAKPEYEDNLKKSIMNKFGIIPSYQQ